MRVCYRQPVLYVRPPTKQRKPGKCYFPAQGTSQLTNRPSRKSVLSEVPAVDRDLFKHRQMREFKQPRVEVSTRGRVRVDLSLIHI